MIDPVAGRRHGRELPRDADADRRMWTWFTLGYLGYGALLLLDHLLRTSSLDPPSVVRHATLRIGYALGHVALLPGLARIVSFTGRQSSLWRQVGAHLAGIVAYAAIVTGPLVVLGRLLWPYMDVTPPSFLGEWWDLLLTRLTTEATHYAVAVVGWYALVYDRRVQRAEYAAAELDRQLAETELNALRTQLEPHFLSNALNAIVAFIHDQPEIAEGMLGRLDRFLRHVLAASHTQRVPLRDELGLVEEYLAIHQFRFGARLEVSVEMADEVALTLVPVLVFQPLVENAIVHGVGSREGPGFVRVTARRAGSRLLTTIEDGGYAHPLEATAPSAPARGIGLGNTERRLASLYGAEWTLVMQRTERGTCVTITFPLDPAP
ncbi:MAG: histidine kinase [Gemmatimonadaceae bacterium]|jgi:signal transduction histidine kinase|nr:histidine kinase [Gemmatimonadaceae bacterium]